MICAQAGEASSIEVSEDYIVKQNIAGVCDAVLGSHVQDTLVVFDLDETLVCPPQGAINSASWRKHCQSVKEKIAEKKDCNVEDIPTGEYEEVLTLAWIAHASEAMESETLNCFNALKAQCSVIALTASLVGRVGDISSFENHRLNMLSELGFSFTQVYKDRLVLKDLPRSRGKHPTYEGGIIFGNGPGSNKGKVLLSFLKKVAVQPKRIVFVDDSKKNVVAVAQALKEANIENVCIHYTQSEHRSWGKPMSSEEFKKQVFPLIDKVSSCEKNV